MYCTAWLSTGWLTTAASSTVSSPPWINFERAFNAFARLTSCWRRLRVLVVLTRLERGSVIGELRTWTTGLAATDRANKSAVRVIVGNISPSSCLRQCCLWEPYILVWALATTWTLLPSCPEEPPPTLMIMLPYVTICSQITYSGVKSWRHHFDQTGWDKEAWARQGREQFVFTTSFANTRIFRHMHNGISSISWRWEW